MKESSPWQSAVARSGRSSLKLAANTAGNGDRPSRNEIKTMQTLTKVALAALMLITTLTA